MISTSQQQIDQLNIEIADLKGKLDQKNESEKAQAAQKETIITKLTQDIQRVIYSFKYLSLTSQEMERCKELEEDIEVLEADLEDTQAERDKYFMELTNLKAKQAK